MKIKLIILIVGLIALFEESNSQCSLGGAYACEISSTHYEKQIFDIQHIKVDFDFRGIDSMFIRAVCTTKLKWQDTADSNRYVFHLNNLKITSIKNSMDIEVPFTKNPKDSTMYFVNYKNLRENSSSLETDFKISYEGKMNAEPGANSWGGVFNHDNIIYSIGVCFNCDYVSMMRHWVPIYDYPSDKFTTDFTYKVKNGKMVLSNGLLTESFEQKVDNTSNYRWESKDQIASYLTNFAYGNFVELDYSTPTLPIKVYSQAKDTTNTKFNFQKINKIVSSEENRFGKYPFEKVAYVNTQNGSMEHQTLISYASSLNSSNKQSNFVDNDVAAHELAHQWFGDLVSPLDFRHAWLTESFATFAESLWMESEYGNSKYQSWLRFQASRYINTVIKTEGAFPLYDFKRTKPSSNYPETIYKKGAIVLSMLRFQLGREQYDQIIRTYLTKFANKNSTTDSLISHFNKESNLDLNWFFSQWVFGKGFPTYRIETGRIDNKLTLKFNETQDTSYGTYLKVPVGLTINYADSTVNRVFIVNNGSEFNTDLPSNFTKISVNLGDSVISLCKIDKVTDLSNEPLYTNDAIQIFPNPVKNKIFIKSASNSIGKITIFSNFGEEILNQNFLNGEEINLDELESGVYFMKIEQNSQVNIEKFIKIN